MKTFVQFLRESIDSLVLPSTLNKLDRETRKKIDYQVHMSRFWYWNHDISNIEHAGNAHFDSLKKISSFFAPNIFTKLVPTSMGQNLVADITAYKFVDGLVYGIEAPVWEGEQALFRHVLLLASGYKVTGVSGKRVTYVRMNRAFFNKPMEYATNHRDASGSVGEKYPQRPSKHVVEYNVPFKIV